MQYRKRKEWDDVLVKRKPYSQNGAVHLDRARPGPTM